ncbi:MAG: molybdopterin-dependent oxidoreductase [Candidatus Cloacimonadaceae bacterium]|nr:molybdopterin-dependent oxidoreductase [Candidatus Cloacimonadaceae bacterium]
MKKAPFHISGKLLLTGNARFVGDEAPLPEMLHAKFLFSPVAHALITKLDVSKAANIKGIARIITADDVPGENQIGHVIKDEPLFPISKIMFYGQPLAIVLSEDERLAEAAAKEIELEYQELPPLLEIDDAEAACEWYIPERKIECGEVDKALMEAVFTISGETKSGAQEHFYMETQRCRAVPGEGNQLTIHTATQSTMEVQEVLSHVLGIPAHNVIVEVLRLGGAFGGKERNATIWACMAGLAAFLCKRPVQVLLTRDEDMSVTGKRHPFKSRWKAGYDSRGRICAYDLELMCNGGAYADLSIAILERAMFHAENCYHIPNARIRGRACRTNLPPNTAFRGFGAPQGIFVIESVIEEIADLLKLDPIEVRKVNLYQNKDFTPYGQQVFEIRSKELFDKLLANADYTRLKSKTELFNKQNQYLKQGIGFVPVKFGISFTTALLNQGSALIWVYIDGSVSVSTGGIEMGQELSTKVAIVVSRVLGISISLIRIESANSQRVGNASPTAASTGSDINANAARIAAEKIKTSLTPAARKLLQQKYQQEFELKEIVFDDSLIHSAEEPDKSITFVELIRFAYNERVPLAAYGYYATPGLYFDREKGRGNPFHYYVSGCALSRVQIDLLSGEHRVRDTYIVHENGSALSMEIDRGQIIGAFVQGYGWCTMEELLFNTDGRYLAVNPSTYKIPTVRDIPENLQVEILASQDEHASVMGSKATGEPPFIYGLSVYFAIRNALRSINADAVLGFPATPEAVLKALDRQ